MVSSSLALVPSSNSELQWTLRSANGPGAVPSHAHLDLLRAGIITEPNLGVNDYTKRWVFYDNWTYTASLEPLLSSSEVQAADRALLVFYGIDTVANVFVQWVFDVTDIVQTYTGTTNTFGARVDARRYPDDNGTFEVPGYRHYLRKIQSDYGWDWVRPPFVPSGIHKPAYLVTLPSTAASHIEITTSPMSPSGTQSTPDIVFIDFIEESSIDIYKLGQNFSTPPVEDADWVVNLEYESEVFEVGTISARTDAPMWVSVQWTIPDDAPERWWPFNLGTPQLYNLTVALDLPTSVSVTFTTRTGFRTVQLKGLTPGDQWHFEVNGVAFYASWNNPIPLDPFYPRIRTEGMRWLLESAKLTGQSMLRVWGGGTYQLSSSFVAGGVYDVYALCDELGILTWSESIFSDVLYPANPWFLDTIEPEVRQNVRRVNRHPSNVQWAGGNENEGITLYYQVWVEVCVELVQDFLYRFTTEETRSRYNYDETRAFNYSTFPLSRFVNEFGWHAMPSSPDDFEFYSTVVMSRDYHPPARLLDFPNPNAPQGQYEMTAPVELWLPSPSTTDAKHNFTQWCWSTQVFQAMEISAQVAFYRRGAGRPERNLGALVWQLNDVWQSIPWAAIKYSGRWKLLQYALGNVFEEVARLEVDVVSDRLEGYYDWKGEMLRSEVVEFGVGALNYTTVLEGEGVTDILPDDRAKEDVWLLVNSMALVDGEIVTSKNYFTPTSLAHANLVDPEVQLTHEGDLVFTLNAKGGVAPLTWLEHLAGSIGYLADNATGRPSIGFYLTAGKSWHTCRLCLVPEIDRTLKFVLNADLSQNSQPSADHFVVRSLWNYARVGLSSDVPKTKENNMWNKIRMQQSMT
ncbi:glycoside hydrolase family 2 protein [Schizophyllum commune]